MTNLIRMASLAGVLVLAANLPSFGAPQEELPALTPADMREDLVYLRDVWSPQDQSFDSTERDRFEHILSETMGKADRLTRTQFSLEIARAVASAHNGHTMVMWSPGFHGLPFKACWFSDGLYVVRTHPRFQELLGARIERFGALTAETALERVTPYISGTDSHVRDLSPAHLRLLEVLHQIGAAASTREVAIRFTLQNGKVRTIHLKAEPDQDPEGLPQHQQLIRTRAEKPPVGRWPHVLDRLTDVPTAYRAPVDVSSDWLSVSVPTLYVRSTQIASINSEPLLNKLGSVFFNQVLDEKQHVRAHHVIVDLRFNSGGNLLETALFCQALPKILPAGGKVFVLIGPGTFSAALATAAMLKGNGGDRTVLIGDTMGDSPQFWAEGKPSSLPHSGISVGSATAYHDWSNGCPNPTDCYWANAAFVVKGTSLEPQVRIIPKFADYAAGRDPVFEAALELAK